MPDRLIARREFVRSSVGTLGAIAAAGSLSRAADVSGPAPAAPAAPRGPDTVFSGEQLDQIAFPMGGFGAGMMCLEGSGALTNVSVRDRPMLQNQPGLFAAISIGGPAKNARVVEGPVPRWKLFERRHAATGSGPMGMGLPRFARATFRAHFPFARVELADPALPVTARVTGWSPFEPGDADNSSLPAAGLEYTFTNTGDDELDAVFSFHARNFLPAVMNEWQSGPETARSIRGTPGGFTLYGGAWPSANQEEAWCSFATDDPAAKVNLAWFRGNWFDPQTMAWRDVEQGAAYDRPAPTEGRLPTGASLFVPFHILPGASKTVRMQLAWYAPRTRLRDIVPQPDHAGTPADYYQPWYASRFASIDELAAYWRDHYMELRRKAERFSDCFFDSTLPPEAVEAAAANLSILKSSTVLRQADGRLWGWEGCDEDNAQGPGTCTHVWNYAQSIAHLFPALERTLRETEFTVGQDEHGHQNFRVALPIQESAHDFYAAADGQLGGVMKAHREWRIGGDTAWLRRLWPRIRASLDYCIATWDPEHKGWAEEPQHNTYDIQFWGPNGMISSFYAGALKAAAVMGRALGEDVAHYEDLLARGTARINGELFNGEYYFQRVEWKNLRAKVAVDGKFYGEYYSKEAADLLEREGPKYQYGAGCLSDGVLGCWLALACGLGQVLDPEKVRNHLKAVHRHNFKGDLSAHANPQRATYANGREGGLLLCSWPRGDMPSLPFVYSNEVWTGIEYQAASHMILMGLVGEGLEIVRACRARYDGKARNPFDEYEWGHWYARAMASYGLLQALSGACYDAVDGVLHLQPAVKGDFRSFICAATGYGTVGVADGKPFLKVVAGTIPVGDLRYTEAPKGGA
ncbi:MAG TPA: GH116 family glycosyl hydrolase [Opitutaceae bacterium]|nr:GH116 family glycosyl hydrolase [Opitutaceae bacterium]